MRLILIGCEYAGTTTLANALVRWAEEAMGAFANVPDEYKVHDHFKIPHISHPPGLSDEEQRQILADLISEPVDPVRVITNRSSGKMGYAIAQAARDRGATTVVVSAPTTLPDPVGIRVVQVETALEMHEAVRRESKGAHALIMAAAVSDWRPAHAAPQKLKKGSSDTWTVELTKNPDILAQTDNDSLVKVGFAAESQDLIANAQSKLVSKGLDLIVANDITAEDAGFAADTNRVTILDREGGSDDLPLMSKYDVGVNILDRVRHLFRQYNS